MSNDIEIIKKLEKKLGRIFKEQFLVRENYLDNYYAQYELNNTKQVIKLYLSLLQEVPFEITQLKNLQRLDLSRNEQPPTKVGGIV